MSPKFPHKGRNCHFQLRAVWADDSELSSSLGISFLRRKLPQRCTRLHSLPGSDPYPGTGEWSQRPGPLVAFAATLKGNPRSRGLCEAFGATASQFNPCICPIPCSLPSRGSAVPTETPPKSLPHNSSQREPNLK